MENTKVELEAIFGENNVSADKSGNKFSINKNGAENILNEKGNEDFKTLFNLKGDKYVLDTEKMFKGVYGTPKQAANLKDPSYNKKLLEYGADRARVAKVIGKPIGEIKIDFATGDLFIPAKLISEDFQVIQRIIDITNSENFSNLNTTNSREQFGLSEYRFSYPDYSIKIHADNDGVYYYEIGDTSGTDEVLTHEDLAKEIMKNLNKFNGIYIDNNQINIPPKDALKPVDRSKI